MNINELLMTLGGISVSIMSYFLKNGLDEIRQLRIDLNHTESELAVLQNDHNNKYANLTEKFDMLYLAVNELTKEIGILNKTINKMVQ